MTRIVETEDLWEPTRLVPLATPEAVLAHDWVVGPFADADTGLIRLSIGTFGIQVGDERIIVDTCGGNDKVRPGSPRLHLQQTDYLERLTAAGFPRTKVDWCARLIRADGSRRDPAGSIQPLQGRLRVSNVALLRPLEAPGATPGVRPRGGRRNRIFFGEQSHLGRASLEGTEECKRVFSS